MKKFKRHKDLGFWDQDIRLSKLSQLGDPLERLNNGIDFEMFRKILEEKMSKQPKGKGGRPTYDYIGLRPQTSLQAMLAPHLCLKL